MEPTESEKSQELLKKLHEANEHFHDRKGKLEEAMDSCEDGHHERVKQAGDELHHVEEEVEEVERKIKEHLDEK
jgi:hypothetical protein